MMNTQSRSIVKIAAVAAATLTIAVTGIVTTQTVQGANLAQTSATATLAPTSDSHSEHHEAQITATVTPAASIMSNGVTSTLSSNASVMANMQGMMSNMQEMMRQMMAAGMTNGMTNTLPSGSGMMAGDMVGMMTNMQGRISHMQDMNRQMMAGGLPAGMAMMDNTRDMMSWCATHRGSPTLNGIKPLPVEEAQMAVKDYISGLSNNDLDVGEVLIFDNHAYARIVERSTGTGAFEVLVDPVTLAVQREPGPSMMWDTKYDHLRGMGTSGTEGMMGMSASSASSDKAAVAMPVNAAAALQSAQHYLDVYLPGAKVDKSADPFYGYYTIDVLRDGKTVGMLSVNGYTRQVVVHTWHGTPVETAAR